MGHHFLLIGEKTETLWPLVLEQSVLSLGTLQVISEKQAEQQGIEQEYTAIIIDAGAVDNVAQLVSNLRKMQPASHIIVVTASPTWQRAREVLLAGATDYIRKSFDQDELLSKIKAALDISSPAQSQ
ncbi:MAG: response regulator [Anaerolineae bacterium]|nr:response regulator [Anaerolineae bacterium]